MQPTPVKMNKKIYLFIIFTVISLSSIHARHIIGGVMSYVCNGEGSYSFTIKMYRDCSDEQAANFDFNAPVSIFQGDNDQEIQTLFVEYESITDVDPPNDNPCVIIPPSVCVEEAIYTFDYIFDEWPITESYTFAYQRCCRNNNITNVLNPQETGATFSTVILPESQEVCNNSPVFNNFPPTVICAGSELNFDHSATDIDNDLIIYELCAPLKGGGLAGVLGNPGNTDDCDGVTPTPACPPSGWEPIEYETGYSALNPIGGMPAVTINSSTGEITGIPPVSGQFVVGVCAYEYRNGELLSVLQRDFQFNVTDCEELVNVDVPADSVVAGADFYFSSCQTTTISFENESTQQQYITDWFWQFDFLGQDTLFDEWEPTITFPSTGFYPGVLILNPDTDCGDTANILVNIFPELTADFEFDYDTCVAGPVFFEDLSFSGSGPIEEWAWDFGNETIDSLAEPFVQYDEAAVWDVALEVTDKNGCTHDTVKSVTYFPVPNLIVVSPSESVTCPPAEIIFENLSSPVDSTYITNWDFGDGGVGTDVSPTYTYDSVGLYTVSLEITSPIGCVTDTTYTDLVWVKPPPVAEFGYNEKEEFSNFSPDIELYDLSDYPAYWEWFDDGESFSREPNPAYVFPDTGVHEVKLVIYSEEGCIDTTTQMIDVEPHVRFFLPNAFTPNWDTVNDEYGGEGFLRGVTNYNLQIWDRWGEMIFNTTDPEELWNGQKNNEGRPAPGGVYVCHVTFTGPRGEPFEFKSFATLIR